MSKGYWEGWGFNDTFKVVLTGKIKDVSSGLKEMKQAFPKSDVKKINTKSFYVFVYDDELSLVKKIAKMFNLNVSYETGGVLDRNKLVYVLYQPTPKGIKILNENGRTYLSWWQSDLNRGDSERLLERLQIQNLILGGLRYTGDTSDLKFEQGGNIGEVLATSNPYIGGAKVIQGIAPESVSALDKKMASQINPDPNRPIFFSNGGKTPKEKNITNYKKAVESYINDRYKEDVDWSESMILFDDRSEETKIKKAVIVTKQGNEYEVYHDDIFSMFKRGGMTTTQQKNKMGKVMHEFKEGTLHSSSGQKVTDRKQAIAIGLSEAGLSKYETGGKLEDFDINTLDAFEKMQYDRLSKMMSKSEALQVIINDVEGDYSQLSPKLSEIAEKQKFMSGGQVRKIDLNDAVIYNGETWFYTEKNGVKGITNTSQGAWGSNYPFIALSKLDVENDLTDMYGKKVKFKEGGKVLASSPTKEGVSKLIEQYLYGSTITLVETEDDKIYEVHNKKGKTPFYVELKRGKYNFIQPTTFSLGGGISDSEMNEILQDLEKSYLQGTRDLKLNSDKEQIQNGRVMWENFPQERKGRLYQYLKKYDIIGEQQYIWVGDLEKINNFKAKIKELKSNGYSVIQKISAPDKKRTKSFRFIAVKPKQKFDNGGTTGSTDYSVAQTILNQLGGMKRLVIMTGAYNFVASSNAVSFRIKNRKVNYIKITLNGNDLYDLKFSRIVKYNEKVVKEYSDIYFDQLIPIFEETTGMYLRMFKKGGFINTQNRDMVIAQLKTIHHHEQEMLETLKRSGEVEAWVLSKVSNASSDLSDIAHYLEFKN